MEDKKMNSGLKAGTIQQKGLVVCNIGMGKGKTTAAMGIVARAAGSGLNVFILQFVKAKPRDDAEGHPLSDRKAEGEWPLSNEIEFFNRITIPPELGKIETEVCGLGFVGILGDQKEKQVHVDAARHGLVRAKELMESGEYQLLVFDEILSAIEVGLLTEDEVAELIMRKPEELHLVITGHNKYPKIIELCNTVTEMKMIKHGYYEGIEAVAGIDF